ncbi:MAG: 7-cyano-7-deazaguanine synthase, partial [Amphiplicatus sp.]
MRALLLSGGIDSSALAYWMRPDICVTVNYGQRAALGEIAAARAICSELNLEWRLIEADLSTLGSGDMGDRPPSAQANAPEFWPYRNQMLVTLAAMLLQPEGLDEILIGSVASDLHADGSPAFVAAMNALLIAQEGAVRFQAPALTLSSENLLRRSKFPRELIGLTFSCHVH